MTKIVNINLAEPSPLGLFGLSLGCLLLMMADFKATTGTILTIPWLILLPGLLQFIAGVVDFFRNNIFGATAFIGYSFLWIGLGFTKIIIIFKDDLPKPITQHLGIICIGYLIFSIMLCILSAGINKTFFVILVFIIFAIFFLILHIFIDVQGVVVGVFLLGVFVSSFYGFFAILLLKLAGGEVLPIGKPLINWKDFIKKEKAEEKEEKEEKISIQVDKN